MALARLQKRFVDSVLKEGEPAALGDIIPGGRLSPLGAIEVYRKGYVARLTSALGETYEAVWWVLGDRGFFRTCREFIRRHPSGSYNLSDYGPAFPRHLARIPESKQFPFLAELARFEWEFKELFHANDNAPLDPKSLPGPAEAAGLRFDFGSARLFASPHAVYEVWRRRSEGAEARSLISWDRPARLLLYKRDGEAAVARLEEPEFQLLKKLARGLTLGRALGAARGLDAPRVSNLFTLLAEAGIGPVRP